MSNYELDDETLRLVAQLQLEDLGDLLSPSKGKYRAGSPTDYELAVQAYKLELESFSSFLSDKSLAKNITRAVNTDGSVVNGFVLEEKQARQGRDLEFQLSESRFYTTESPKDVPASSQFDDELLGKFQTSYVSPTDSDDLGFPAESSSQAASRPRPDVARQNTKECIACERTSRSSMLPGVPAPMSTAGNVSRISSGHL